MLDEVLLLADAVMEDDSSSEELLDDADSVDEVVLFAERPNKLARRPIAMVGSRGDMIFS